MNKIKKAFTLIEIIIISVILGIVFLVIIQIYFSLIKMKVDIFTKAELAKNTNSLMEKINIIMKNYTIDYEEYFNRRIVGCNSDGGNSFSWDVGNYGYCKSFTSYGNGNSIEDSNSNGTGYNILYYCSSVDSDGSQKEYPGKSTDCKGDNNTGSAYIYSQKNNNDLINGSGCWKSEVGVRKFQSFGEYKLQFWDLKGNADGNRGCQGDDDDTDLGIGPVAIGDNLHVKELYLISKDGTKRIYLRRKLISTGDWNGDSNIDYTGGEALYKLQILKLKGFDIGSDHKAGTTGNTVNDGKIDTWACDAEQGFICNGDSIGGGYTDHNLPKDSNDGWTDMTINDITLTKFDLSIFPTIKPSYGWYDTGIQLSPYVRVNLQTRFYPKNYIGKVNPDKMRIYSINLQTTFSIKPY